MPVVAFMVRTNNGSDELQSSDMVRLKQSLVGPDALINKGRPNHTMMVGTKPSGPTVRAVVTAIVSELERLGMCAILSARRDKIEVTGRGGRTAVFGGVCTTATTALSAAFIRLKSR